MSKQITLSDSTLSATSSFDGMFTSSVNYVKKQSESIKWEYIIIACLVIVVLYCMNSNRSKNKIIREQSAEIERSKSRSNRYRSTEYDEYDEYDE